jgi:hypothetical protein
VTIEQGVKALTKRQEKFITREGSIDDMRDNWLWWNDPKTREMMRTQETVPWEGHVAWFKGVLDDPDRYLCMFEDVNSKIGVVRFDPKEEPIYEVSINLNPERRGQGLGAALIDADIVYVNGVRRRSKNLSPPRTSRTWLP